METIELKVEDVAYLGKGIARPDGKVVFVPGALPGEIVRAEIVRHGRNFSEAYLREVVSPAPQRIRPVCPLAFCPGAQPNTACAGCAYQHVEYPAELALKQKQFVNIIQRMAGLDPAVCLQPVAAPRPLGYRNKIVLHGAVGAGTPVLGYYKTDNATVLDVAACPLAVPAINELLASTRADRSFAGTITDHTAATYRYTEIDGAMMWLDQPSDADSWLTETTAIGKVKVPRGCFFQVNTAVADLLINHVTGLIKQVNPAAVIDAYCGVGVFALAASHAGVKNVVGLEMDARASATAVQNARKHECKGVEFKATTAQKGLKWALSKCDSGRTTIIVDPPRKGLEMEVVQRISAARPAGIIYIACAADTMARDVKQLRTAGYAARSARLFDMFPRTPYFESVVWLIREDRS